MTSQVLSRKQLDALAASNGGFGDYLVYRDREDELMYAARVSFHHDGRYSVVLGWGHEIEGAKLLVKIFNWEELLGSKGLGEGIRNGDAYMRGIMPVKPDDLCTCSTATGEFRFDPHTGWVIGARACAATPRDADQLTNINDAFPARVRVGALQDTYGDAFHGMTFALEELAYLAGSGREVGPQSIFGEPGPEPKLAHAQKVGVHPKCV